MPGSRAPFAQRYLLVFRTLPAVIGAHPRVDGNSHHYPPNSALIDTIKRTIYPSRNMVRKNPHFVGFLEINFDPLFSYLLARTQSDRHLLDGRARWVGGGFLWARSG